MWMRVMALILVLTAAAEAQSLRPLGPLDASRRVTYFIAEGAPGSQYRQIGRAHV